MGQLVVGCHSQVLRVLGESHEAHQATNSKMKTALLLLSLLGLALCISGTALREAKDEKVENEPAQAEKQEVEDTASEVDEDDQEEEDEPREDVEESDAVEQAKDAVAKQEKKNPSHITIHIHTGRRRRYYYYRRRYYYGRK